MNTKDHRQPKGLPFLFLSEMWERFGFYTLQGLLILYMTQYFGFTDNLSYTILGIFMALVYIAPLIGGYLASHILGFTVSIIWGGLFLVLGYALLALPYTTFLFYPALATIIVGNGLFKPNISSLLGTQYAPEDPKREAGFTIFYVGINIGAMCAGFSSGYVKDYFGWHASFALASFGLVIGLITFCYGLKYLTLGGSPNQNRRPPHYQMLLYCAFTIILLTFLLKAHVLADWLLPAVGVLLFVVLTILTLKQHPLYKKRMAVLNVLILSSIIFWMLFLQIFYSANLFVDRLVSKNFLGIPLTTTVFYASEAVFIILFGPLFAWGWQTLSHRHQNPSPLTKFTLGIFLVGLGFLLLSISTLFPDQAGLIGAHWVFLAYLLITLGELLLSPIGLSAVTTLSPPRLTGMMMGVWFVATGFGGIFAGWLAKLSSLPDSAITLQQKLAVYHNAFLDYAYLAFFVALVLFFMMVVLKNKLRI